MLKYFVVIFFVNIVDYVRNFFVQSLLQKQFPKSKDRKKQQSGSGVERIEVVVVRLEQTKNLVLIICPLFSFMSR